MRTFGSFEKDSKKKVYCEKSGFKRALAIVLTGSLIVQHIGITRADMLLDANDYYAAVDDAILLDDLLTEDSPDEGEDLNNYGEELLIEEPLYDQPSEDGEELYLPEEFQYDSASEAFVPQDLLQEDDYTPEKKAAGKRISWFPGVYWLGITAIFIAYSFITNNWGRSWIIWPIAGVLFAAIYAVLQAIAMRKKNYEQES